MRRLEYHKNVVQLLGFVLQSGKMLCKSQGKIEYVFIRCNLHWLVEKNLEYFKRIVRSLCMGRIYEWKRTQEARLQILLIESDWKYNLHDCCIHDETFTLPEPIWVVTEYVAHGDLLGFLRKCRGIQDTVYHGVDTFCGSSLTQKQLLNMAKDIACGMAHLSRNDVSELSTSHWFYMAVTEPRRRLIALRDGAMWKVKLA